MTTLVTMFDSKMRHFKARAETARSWYSFSCASFVPSDSNVIIAHTARLPIRRPQKAGVSSRLVTHINWQRSLELQFARSAAGSSAIDSMVTSLPSLIGRPDHRRGSGLCHGKLGDHSFGGHREAPEQWKLFRPFGVLSH